jgi:hypothetical protein
MIRTTTLQNDQIVVQPSLPSAEAPAPAFVWRAREGALPHVHGNAGGLFTVPFKLALMLMMRVMDVPMRMDNTIG